MKGSTSKGELIKRIVQVLVQNTPMLFRNRPTSGPFVSALSVLVYTHTICRLQRVLATWEWFHISAGDDPYAYQEVAYAPIQLVTDSALHAAWKRKRPQLRYVPPREWLSCHGTTWLMLGLYLRRARRCEGNDSATRPHTEFSRGWGLNQGG
ncbi:hypothetical protein BD413DRAFT_204096 [Trametes elegans]|nr:hypothetical protein BD413DRAFT_204096 [Trametes elegans]